MIRGKSRRVDEEKEVEVLDLGFVTPPPTIVVEEWRLVLRPTTEKGKIRTIWHRHFNFSERSTIF